MRFAKMQGVGNDFVVIDAIRFPPDTDWAVLARMLCERRFGIGADGLLVLAQARPEAGLRFRMFNPDGSEDMCGNGLRCAGLYAFRADWLDGQTTFTAWTKEGPRSLTLLSIEDDAHSALLSVDMGRPQFAPTDIPFTGTNAPVVVDFPLLLEGETYFLTAVNTGSTHTVIWTDGDVDEETFARVSPLIENNPLFPERTSVLWVTPTGPHDVSVRIWERGAGETLGCGTGACAVAIAARVQNRVGAGSVRVTSRGGMLSIDWPGSDDDILMTGPAAFVYEGEWNPAT